MRDTRYENGFSLVELLVALVVTGIVLAAVATLAYAVGAANDVADDSSQKQAQVRYATLRISELIRHCKLIWSASSNNLTVWQADDDSDGQIDTAELVYIEAVQGTDYIQIQLRDPNTDPVVLIPQCSSVQFVPYPAAPQTQFVSILFDLDENGVTHNYQINTSLRAWAGNLLDGSGNIVSDDD